MAGSTHKPCGHTEKQRKDWEHAETTCRGRVEVKLKDIYNFLKNMEAWQYTGCQERKEQTWEPWRPLVLGKTKVEEGFCQRLSLGKKVRGHKVGSDESGMDTSLSRQ